LLRNLAKTLGADQNSNLLFLEQLGRLIKKCTQEEIRGLLYCRCVRHKYRSEPKCSIQEMLQEDVKFIQDALKRLRGLFESERAIYEARLAKLERLNVWVQGVMVGEITITEALAAERLAQALAETQGT